jgi:putative DNA primase/helicase
MPVLEGKMGRGKSSFLSILGGEWYDSVTKAISDKEFLQDIQGLWLVEIPDMTGFGRREHSHILAAVTVRNDRYRASYGRTVENHPRTCVFAATSETDDYLQDIRGRRRFWPLRCTMIDLDALHAQREQVFAEAVHAYRDGEKWYEVPESADEEQLSRATPDLWTDKVLDHVSELPVENGRRVVSLSHVLYYAIDMKLSQQDQIAKNRVVSILRADGWIPGVHKGSRCWVKIEKKRPEGR